MSLYKVALGDHDKGSEQQQGKQSIKSIIFSNIFSLFYINLYFHLDFKINCIHINLKTVTRNFFYFFLYITIDKIKIKIKKKFILFKCHIPTKKNT
jgi:hypothetical protein